jgi:isopenicillin N synthase-like dioxygenase
VILQQTIQWNLQNKFRYFPPLFTMGSINGETKTSFTIPTVDVSAYLADPTSTAAQEVTSQIRLGCRTSGFFQITGHGIPRTLQDAVFKAAKTFFSLPQDEKTQYGGVQGRGYEMIGAQILEPGTKPELKEVRECRCTRIGKPI